MEPMRAIPGWNEAGLWVIVLAVLVLPFASKTVERDLEAFLLACGLGAATLAGRWSIHLLREALVEPLPIVATVLVVGLAFHAGRGALDRAFRRMEKAVSPRTLAALLVIVLGLLSSVITAIIAALVLVEVIHLMRAPRAREVKLAILACFAIGLGAALTPVGEPLSTIVTAKLDEDFWFLARQFGRYLVPGVLLLGGLAAMLKPAKGGRSLRDTGLWESAAEPYIRAGKIYAFVAALLLLGAGLVPLTERYITNLPAAALFWANMISAVVDNATLAAAEVVPGLTPDRLTAIILGLLVSGGMLIPGNIPNIVAASRLRITAREWARTGVPLGLALLAAYFLVWRLLL